MHRCKVGWAFSPTRIILFFTVYCLLFAIYSSPAFAKKTPVPTPKNQYKYQQKILRKETVEKYERSLLPESGFMTREEYEELSKDIPNSDKVIPEYKLPKDIKMKYVPQPTYKLARYNDPPGSPELHIARKFFYDRQVTCGAITSPNKDVLVYPVVYYYANNQCTAGELYAIPLDMSLPVVDRILRSNIIKRSPDSILSTPKEIREKFIFRTMTPVDFSADGSKLVAKEKIGNSTDGIWKTNLWVYDFTTKQSREIPEIREAIKFYWMNTEGLALDEKRWDIYPLGFDLENPDRVIVSAYGYTGKNPKFLGNWSIDCQGEQSRLVSLFEAEAKVSINGFKVVKDSVVDPTKVHTDEKKQDKLIKKKRKAEKKEAKKEKKNKKKALKKNLKEMKHEEKAVVKEYNKQMHKTSPTE